MGKKVVENKYDLDKILKNKWKVNINEENKLDELVKMVNLIKGMEIKLKYNCIKVGPSGIHGLGIFATEDIPANKIVTFYPAHSVTIKGESSKQNKIIEGTVAFRENYDLYYDLYTLGDTSKMFGEYEITGDPHNRQNNLFLGHLLNDSHGNLFDGIKREELHNYELCWEIFEEYKMLGSGNCYIEGFDDLPIFYIRTCKHVKKGTELLTLYGPSYWYGIEYKNIENIEQEISDLKNLAYYD